MLTPRIYLLFYCQFGCPTSSRRIENGKGVEKFEDKIDFSFLCVFGWKDGKVEWKTLLFD